MADKIDRKLVKVYAGNSSASDVQTKDGVATKDVSVLQDANYIQGLRTFLTNDGIMPSFESSWNAALYVLSNQIKYATDRGISEYDPDTEYYIGDPVRIVAGGSIYTSKTDNNIGNALSDINHWQPDLNGSVPIGMLCVTGVEAADIATYYPNWIIAAGQEVSRTTYPLLFQFYGTKYGAGNGTTTFNVPDLQDRMIAGAGGQYNLGDTAGNDNIKLSQSQLPNVKLTVNALSIPSLSVSGTTNDFSHEHEVGIAFHNQLVDTATLEGNYFATYNTGSTVGCINVNPSNYRPKAKSKTIQHTISGATGASTTGTGTTSALGSGNSIDIRNKLFAGNVIIRAL